jgi:intron-binding protein aquarius
VLLDLSHSASAQHRALQRAETARSFWCVAADAHLPHSVWPSLVALTTSGSAVDAAVAASVAALLLAHADVAAEPFAFVADAHDAALMAVFSGLLHNGHHTLDDDDVARDRLLFLHLLALLSRHIERRAVRKAVLHWLSLPIWASVGERRRAAELDRAGAKLAKAWHALVAKQQHVADAATAFPSLLRAAAASLEAAGRGDADAVLLVGATFALLVDVESQLATRRFAWLAIDASHLLPAAQVALHADGASQSAGVALLRRHLAVVRACHAAPIDAFRGVELSPDMIDSLHSARVRRLQSAAFQLLVTLPATASVTVKNALTDVALGNAALVDQRASFGKLLADVDSATLAALARDALLLDADELARFANDAALREALTQAHERPADAHHDASSMSLFPDERQLFDAARLPEWDDEGAGVELLRVPLALPKVGLQYLSMRDYLLRNFELYHLMATYDVRYDLEEALSLLKPRPAPNGVSTVFGGVARMALPVAGCAIRVLDAPRVGERKPARVVGELAITLAGLPSEWASEWDALQRHDALFLVTLDVAHDSAVDTDRPFAERFGVAAVRGCTLLQLEDDAGLPMLDDGGDGRRRANGVARKLSVAIDAAQYAGDSERGAAAVDRVYSRINVLVRRKQSENTFKSALESIRDLLMQHESVPEWLSDALLGYGDPSAAASGHYNVDADADNASVVDQLDCFDTFLDAEHVREAFAGRAVEFAAAAADDDASAAEQPAKKSKRDAAAASDAGELAPPYRVRVPRDPAEPVRVSTYEPVLQVTESSSGYRNCVRFTPRQSEAIVRGMMPGLTLIIGPPGTGKTDCAAQIVSNLYHAHPNERILLVTHSNAALNHLFDKLVLRDIDRRHMLRLGHGADQLAANEDFSRFGRVSYMLARRLELLASASELAHSLPTAPMGGNDVNSCQLAEHLFTEHVRPLFDAWLALGGRTEYPFAAWERVQRQLPADAALLPSAADAVARLDAGRAMFARVAAVFDELRDCRAFEIMRSAKHRSDYLTTHQARIVAMTTTHAAMRRTQLAELGFAFDSVVMEEAGQVLEIDTFVSLMMQQRAARLKRVTLIGDHRQLPPVVTSAALRKHSQFDQSMFARLIRLGVPAVQLDAQGRARPALARLFAWRYAALRNLPQLEQATAAPGSPYALANAGLALTAQFIDVPDYQGNGETTPLPHFYQNLGEAEYVVALYIYMRLIGYPAQSITMLATYNGQKQLLRDVVNARCANHPLYGRPGKISTVDKYQGQQNDIVLLSLVRTKNVGHVRDARRMIVALSRARLGLYVFGRAALFAQCAELQPALGPLLAKPLKLALVRNERFGATTRAADDETSDLMIEDVVQLSSLLN